MCSDSRIEEYAWDVKLPHTTGHVGEVGIAMGAKVANSFTKT